MAMPRCPSCAAPMTDAEARTGQCPMCDAEVAAPAAEPIPAAGDASPTSQRLFHGILIAVGGSLLFCLAPMGAIIYFSWPERPPVKEELAQEKPPAHKEVKVEPKKKLPAPEKKADNAKTDLTPPEKKSLDPSPEDKEAPKKDEPKKVEPKEVAKVEEPKKIDVKEIAKVEPKKVLPVEFPKRWASLRYLDSDAIKLDGDLSDWKDIPTVQMAAIERGKAPRKPVAAPATQKAHLAYCAKGLLIAVDVVDTSGELESEGQPGQGMWPFWNNDTIEIFIDTLNARPKQRGDASAHQFFAFPLGTPNDGGMHGFESRILKNKAGRTDWTIAAVGNGAIQRAGKKTANGWTMEVLITNAAFRQGEIRPGVVFGFELQIDTGTNIFYQWANHNPLVQISTNPSVWGEILFAGSDGKVELLDAAGKPATQLTPGTPLTVRVRDADVNLDPAKKESLALTLITRGGRKPMILAETEPNSGVFQGVMPTRLATRRPEDGVLELAADETVTVDYIDRLRSDGSRNVTVRAAIRCR